MAFSTAQMSACSVLDIEPLDLAIYFTEDGEHAAKTASQEYVFHSNLMRKTRDHESSLSCDVPSINSSLS